ncbi:MAG: hypothetical protein WBB45_21940 [Cyclobacteriaceae bacterium]
MRKLTLTIICALFMLSGTAFTEKNECKSIEAQASVETVSAEEFATSFEGKVLWVGLCDWTLKLCSNGGRRTMSKKGVNPVAGQYYYVTTSGFDNCGYKVSTIYSSSCTL